MVPTNWWCDSVDVVARKLGTDVHSGLSSKEARRRLKKYGRNELPTNVRKAPFRIILDQFSNIFVWLLLGAAVISFLMGQPIDALIIVIILVATVSITFFQEYKAEASIALLLDITRPLATVVRDGVKLRLPSYYVVPGDLVFIETGDVIVADGRVIESIRITADESSLTGESTPSSKTAEALAEKEVAIGDRKNMLFRGTAILSGRGCMLITETGAATELGKIAHLLQAVNRRKTFFETRLDRLVRTITWLCFSVIGVAIVVGLVKGISPNELFFIALSLIVAAIPEVLPLTTTLALAYGTKRMAQHHILMRRLSAVETLGRVSVICSDKTGTLTKNEKVVTWLWTLNTYTQVTGQGYIPEGTFERGGISLIPAHDAALLLTLKIGVLCNAAHLYNKNGIWGFSGDPSEAALLVVGQKAGFTAAALDVSYPQLVEIPFDATLRLMGSVRTDGQEKKLYVKGAYDTLVPSATHYMTTQGTVELLTPLQVLEIQREAKQLADKGLRLFAVAYRLCDDTAYEAIRLNENLIFVGLFGMTDPLRPGVRQAISACCKAGIRTVMVTGDHPDTATAIGQELGLLQPGLCVITGPELDSMSDQELQRIIPTVAICARSSVEHKVRIVKAWQASGAVVATTGDGINDAPALKIADIGIAMGQSGTALAKEASDIILLDDNFASIVRAVQEGRGIFDSIRKNAGYIIATTVAELGVVCGGIIWGLTDDGGKHLFVLLPIHLLWLDLMTEMLMTTALTNDPLNPKNMQRQPREFAEDLLPFRATIFPAFMGFVVALGALSIFYFGLKIGSATSSHMYTLMFTAMVIFELIALQIIRLYYGIGFMANVRVLASYAGIFVIQLMLIYTPLFARMFHLEPMTRHDWLVVGVLSCLVWGVGFAAVVGVNFFKRKRL